MNYRRRQEEQMGEWLKMSNEKMILSLTISFMISSGLIFISRANNSASFAPHVSATLTKQLLNIMDASFLSTCFNGIYFKLKLVRIYSSLLSNVPSESGLDSEVLTIPLNTVYLRTNPFEQI